MTDRPKPSWRLGPAEIRCAECASKTRVVNSEGDGKTITRTRECLGCGARYITQETVAA